MIPVPAPGAMPDHHRFHSQLGEHVLIVPYSRIYDLPPEWLDQQGDLNASGQALVSALGLRADGEADLAEVPLPPVRSLSLNVSSSCNLACGYCYAGRGSFEGRQKGVMDWPTARQAIERLLAEAEPGQRSTIGFLGGEPFVNRHLIHRVVHYAADAASARGLCVQFAVTTNGTLLSEDDRALLRAHPFAVTVSVDGGAAVQRSQRPAFGSGDSWSAMLDGVVPLLADPGQARVGARATVRRDLLDMKRRFDDILDVGFAEVGFSPLRQGPQPGQGMGGDDWARYGAALRQVAEGELQRARRGGPIRLSNFAIALRQLHRGWAAPYSCGAGGGYFSVAQDGTWYACHRAIGQQAFRMGDQQALDAGARQIFLRKHHVHAQEDCTRCWARYLCSGGCHQEAGQRDRHSCDFIRGWLEFCLAAYCELADAQPGWFATPNPTSDGEHYA